MFFRYQIKITYFVILLIVIISIVYISCRKEDTFDTESDLMISETEILFDTVFSTIGSTTQYFYIKNTSNKAIVTDIYVAAGSSSNYRINVDGISGNSFEQVEIPAGDSIFIFVKVTIDPQNGNTPFVVKDSIIFETNGHINDVDLIAWGQNAHYIVADHSLGSLRYKIVAGEGTDTTWYNDKPYLIYGYAVIDSTGILNIEAGVQVHFYNGSGLWVYKGGALKVNGTKEEPVIFQGSRLEHDYDEVPGQWDRIWINESDINSVINYAIIKNGFIGIQAETMDAYMGNKLVISNTIIRNMTGMGILSRYYRIYAANCLITDCAVYSAALTTGGVYDFRHCTFGNYWDWSTRTTPSLVISDYYEDPYYNVYLGDLDSAYFGNCIIYGNIDEEILTDDYPGEAEFNYFFENCLLKTEMSINDVEHFLNVTVNIDPEFTDYSNFDYTLSPNSAAIDKGNISIITSSLSNITYDLNGNNRLVNPPPDLGAYDYRP